MQHATPPIVLLHTPALAGRDVLRAGLMAMQCAPENLPVDALKRKQRLQALSHHARVFCVVDISGADVPESDDFLSVLSQVPPALRARTVLTRMARGYVSVADRAWVQSFGFAELVPDFDATQPEGGLRLALDLAADSLDLPKLPTVDLQRYLRAAKNSLQPNPARTLVRQLTGLSVEQLGARLTQLLDMQDRTYHLKKYAHCFIASEAVHKFAQAFQLSPEQAVELGQALGALGLLFHVEHAHAFANEALYFRLALSPEAEGIDPGQALAALKQALTVADRTYLGTVYRQCWVGSEAVDVLCARFALPRHLAHLVLHRLMQFGAFEHVVNEKPFIDGKFFYQFKLLNI